MEKQEGLILDIGANNGISSAYFLKIRPQWRIIAFEPNPFHGPSMERFKRKSKNFDYYQTGLSNHSGLMTFYTHTYFGIPLHSSTSTNLERLSGFIEQYPNFIKKRLRVEECTAPVKTLDETNLQPDVIKIDSEGSDFDILQGAQGVLKRCRPYILLENQEERYSDLVHFCEGLNMGIFYYDFQNNRLIRAGNSPTADVNNQRNLVIIPNEKIDDISQSIFIR
jgi:FkbM family methyltransferase